MIDDMKSHDENPCLKNNMQNVRNRLWTIAFFIPAEFSGVKEYGQFCRLVLAGVEPSTFAGH